MDLYCVKCREPWDNDSLHEEVQARVEHANYEGLSTEDITYGAVYAEFTQKGCTALSTAFGPQNECPGYSGEGITAPSDPSLVAVYGLAGTDSDFAASMLEDIERLR